MAPNASTFTNKDDPVMTLVATNTLGIINITLPAVTGVFTGVLGMLISRVMVENVTKKLFQKMSDDYPLNEEFPPRENSHKCFVDLFLNITPTRAKTQNKWKFQKVLRGIFAILKKDHLLQKSNEAEGVTRSWRN